MRWLLVFVAGCDALWGIDHIDVAGDADPSGDRGTVRGRFVERWVENLDDSGTGDPLERSFAASEMTAQVTLDDGSLRAVAIDDEGFSFTTPATDDRYTIRFTTPYGPRTYVARANAPLFAERLRYRPDRELAPAGTTITIDVSNRTTTAFNEELVTTGTWSRTLVKGQPMIRADLSTTDLFGTQIGMLTPHDAVYYTATDANGDYFHMVSSAKVPNVSTNPGADNPVPVMGTLMVTPVTADQCTRIESHGDLEVTRIAALFSDPGTPFPVWFVNVDPSFELALTFALPVASGRADGVVRDVVFGNPFGLDQVDVLRAINVPTTSGGLAESRFVEPANLGCTTKQELPADAVEIPIHVRLGDTLLETTNQVVPVPHNGVVDVTWEPSPTGNADYYLVALDELLGSTATTKEQIVASERHVQLPAGAFTTSLSYHLRVIAVIGFPNAANGDFIAVGSPIGFGSFTTPPFRPQ